MKHNMLQLDSPSSTTSSAMRYLVYARKSSESEERQIQSIEDQLTSLRRLATTEGLLLVGEHLESHSAKNPNSRPVFDEVLSRIENGEADGILCWNINRLSRNPIDSGRLSWLLQRSVIKSILVCPPNLKTK
jgi:DNA invertase Pin-like site-specific DNA recombinase